MFFSLSWFPSSSSSRDGIVWMWIHTFLGPSLSTHTFCVSHIQQLLFVQEFDPESGKKTREFPFFLPNNTFSLVSLSFFFSLSIRNSKTARRNICPNSHKHSDTKDLRSLSRVYVCVCCCNTHTPDKTQK